jgi:all-trans-retinol 13,14-reductase
VHAVGEVTPHSMTGRLLSRLSRGRLQWASLGPVYDEFHYPDGFRIDFPDNPRQFRDNLLAAFPGESRAVDRYFSMVREVAGNMRGYYLARAAPGRLAPVLDRTLARKAQTWLETNTLDVLKDLRTTPELESVLASQWGYYGSVPSRSSFAMQALVTKHFTWGGYYPVGGSKRIAQTLLSTVSESGGYTRIATDVRRIVIEGGRAVGVELSDGEEIRAAKIISAAGVSSTLRRLLPESITAQPWAAEVLDLPPAPAHVCLYIGFKGDITKAGASAANKWFYETWSTEAEGWNVSREGSQPDAPVLYCSFPSLKDPEHDPGPDSRHTGEVVTFVPWEVFAPWRDTRWKKRGADYDAFKSSLSDRLRAQFLRHMPALEPMIDYVEMSTPLSTDNFCRPMSGSIYGIEPTPDRFRCNWLRPRSPVPGLFFAGSEVATVGVIGAMMGGVLAALAAEPLAMMPYLRRHAM